MIKIPEDVKDRLKARRSLPSVPAVAIKIMELSEQDDIGTPEVAAVLARDPALAAKVLKVANAASYGVRCRVVQHPFLAILTNPESYYSWKRTTVSMTPNAAAAIGWWPPIQAGPPRIPIFQKPRLPGNPQPPTSSCQTYNLEDPYQKRDHRNIMIGNEAQSPSF